MWKLEFPEKSCSSWRSPSRFTYNNCKVLVMNPHVSFWDAREVIDSILWWGFHLVRSRISLTFFSSRINNIYYFSSRGFFFWKHDCLNRWEWKQTCKNSGFTIRKKTSYILNLKKVQKQSKISLQYYICMFNKHIKMTMKYSFDMRFDSNWYEDFFFFLNAFYK